jgi:hypothetical protein
MPSGSGVARKFGFTLAGFGESKYIKTERR